MRLRIVMRVLEFDVQSRLYSTYALAEANESSIVLAAQACQDGGITILKKCASLSPLKLNLNFAILCLLQESPFLLLGLPADRA